MRSPTVRLVFQDGTTYDAFYSTWLYAAEVGRFTTIQTIRPGQCVRVPGRAGLATIRDVRTIKEPIQ